MNESTDTKLQNEVEGEEAEEIVPKKALVVQHVTTKYQKKSDGTDAFDPVDFLAGITNWIKLFNPEKAIVTYEDKPDEIYPALLKIATDVVPWKWANFSDTQDAVNHFRVPEADLSYTWANHDFFSVLYPWMKDLAGYDVLIMGGYRDECVLGLTDGLYKLDVDYKVHTSLTY